MSSTINPIDFALRVIESTAFSIHAVLGLTEPFTGCLRSALGDRGAMPSWFWPVAGAILLLVAYLNIHCADNDLVVLAAQAYIAAFHTGGAMYHVRLGHHPATGFAPGVFVVFAFAVTMIRTNVVVAAVGTLICACIAAVLCKILVTVPGDRNEEGSLLAGEESPPEGRAQSYQRE